MPPNNAMKGMTRRNFGRYTLAAGGALMMAGCDLRLSGRFTSADTHVRDYPTVQAVEYFGQLLSERTDGRLGLNMYAGGQLHRLILLNH